MFAVDDLFLLAAFGILGYIVYKNRSQISEKASNAVKNVFEGARKFLTFVVILFTIAFIGGQLFAVSIVGFMPDSGIFYLPFVFLALLIIYYYME